MKLWQGRFSKAADASADEFGASIGFDQRMYEQDIRGSRAHAKMLARQGIITPEDAAKIDAGLADILEEIHAGKITFTAQQEDIHMGIEGILTERIGEPGKRLHTARSRNDQVAVDFRMYLKEETDRTLENIRALKRAFYEQAQAHQDTILPGYTHLQRAQPVTLAFHLLAYFNMFDRDQGRLEDCRKRMDFLPLGSGALAGTAYETDRQFLAKELGFAGVCPNAMDAVSDRDFALEFLSAAAITMMHLSRFCEEMILWSSAEYHFVEMDDAYSTGSSIMPQKKNPDMTELIRGKTGRVYGDLFSLLTIMKGLPLAYNKDMQEDKPPVFDAADTVNDCLSITADVLRTVTFQAESMGKAAVKGFTNATDAADYLVSKGIPFRDCHEIIGKIVLHCIRADKGIEDLSLQELRGFSPLFDQDVYERIALRTCIEAKKSEGSTSFLSVAAQLQQIKEKEQYK